MVNTGSVARGFGGKEGCAGAFLRVPACDSALAAGAGRREWQLIWGSVGDLWGWTMRCLSVLASNMMDAADDVLFRLRRRV